MSKKKDVSNTIEKNYYAVESSVKESEESKFKFDLNLTFSSSKISFLKSNSSILNSKFLRSPFFALFKIIELTLLIVTFFESFFSSIFLFIWAKF